MKITNAAIKQTPAMMAPITARPPTSTRAPTRGQLPPVRFPRSFCSCHLLIVRVVRIQLLQQRPPFLRLCPTVGFFYRSVEFARFYGIYDF